MISALIVFAGGGLGAVLRYAAVQGASFFSGAASAPWAVLAVNVTGSLVMGLALAAAERGMFHLSAIPAQLLFMTGVLGGFTTFSAFSADALRFVQGGQYAHAAVYVIGSVALSLLAVAAGYSLMIGKT